jgi:hypothetical protein
MAAWLSEHGTDRGRDARCQNSAGIVGQELPLAPCGYYKREPRDHASRLRLAGERQALIEIKDCCECFAP